VVYSDLHTIFHINFAVRRLEYISIQSYGTVNDQLLISNQYGAVAGALGLGAHFYSPIYRGLTIQFKVYVFERCLSILTGMFTQQFRFLQLSAMILGGIIAADRRLIAHEKLMRHHNRLKRNAAVRRSYEEDFERLDQQMPRRP